MTGAIWEGAKEDEPQLGMKFIHIQRPQLGGQHHGSRHECTAETVLYKRAHEVQQRMKTDGGRLGSDHTEPANLLHDIVLRRLLCCR